MGAVVVMAPGFRTIAHALDWYSQRPLLLEWLDRQTEPVIDCGEGLDEGELAFLAKTFHELARGTGETSRMLRLSITLDGLHAQRERLAVQASFDYLAGEAFDSHGRLIAVLNRWAEEIERARPGPNGPRAA